MIWFLLQSQPSIAATTEEDLGLIVNHPRMLRACCVMMHKGGGMGQWDGNGDGQGSSEGWRHHGNREIMKVIHKLVAHREEITRTLTDDDSMSLNLKATTVSNNPNVSEWIQLHVAQMQQLVQTDGRIRSWDPLFEALFDHREVLDLQFEVIDGGVEAVLVGETECAQALAEAHTRVISSFLENGYEELHKSHEVPAGRCEE